MKNFLLTLYLECKSLLLHTIILLGLFCATRTNAGTSEAGAIFLIIYPGARPNGMGAAFTAIADDALATYFNDAGMAFQSKGDLALTHANWLPGLYPGMYYEFLSFTQPTTTGRIGGHIIYLTTGNTEGRDETGKKIGEWTTWDASAKFSYAAKATEKLGLGIGAKFIYSFLAPVEIVRQIIPDFRGGGTGTSWAFDVSSLYIPNNLLRIGTSIQNIGPNINYTESGVADPLPWTLRFGIAISPIWTKDNKLVISGELTKILVGFLDDLSAIQKDVRDGLTDVYQDTWRAIGTEYTFGELLSVRGGYFCDYIGKRAGFTFGGGIALKVLRFDIGIDSELYDFKTDNYRFSLHYSF